MIDANDHYSMMDAGNIRRLQESIARLTQERDAAREALEDAVYHLGQHHGCLHVTENPAMQAFYARAHGGDLSEAFKPYRTIGGRSAQEIAARELQEIKRADGSSQP
jgi:hypothetical protein